MISIVIPAYNEEKFLPQCLESLKKQDYKSKFEIIVVDNASTDGTATVAARLGAKVVSCPTRGVAYARGAGARSATGAIIVQADADTVYPSGWLTRIAQHFASHPKSIALAGAYAYQTHPSWARSEFMGRYLMNQFGRLFLGRPVCISGANFAFRRVAFQKTGGYDATSLYPDQWGISSSLSRAGKISYDKNLIVFTSARRVQKPFHAILQDVCSNIGGVLTHFFKYEAARLKTLGTKSYPRTHSSRIAFILVMAMFFVPALLHITKRL